jgi:hypothetical protein
MRSAGCHVPTLWCIRAHALASRTGGTCSCPQHPTSLLNGRHAHAHKHAKAQASTMGLVLGGQSFSEVSIGVWDMQSEPTRLNRASGGVLSRSALSIRWIRLRTDACVRGFTDGPFISLIFSVIGSQTGPYLRLISRMRVSSSSVQFRAFVWAPPGGIASREGGEAQPHDFSFARERGPRRKAGFFVHAGLFSRKGLGPSMRSWVPRRRRGFCRDLAPLSARRQRGAR